MNNRAVTLFRVGAWSFIVVGAGHFSFELAHRLFGAPSPIDAELRAQSVAVLGLRRNLFALNLGFSVAMALFIISCGALSLLFARAMPDLNRRAPAVVRFNLAASLAGLALSVGAFPPPPIVAFAVASICFALALKAEPQPRVS